MYVHLRLAEEYKEQSWAAMSELEKELQQIEAQYGEEFGDASESEEEDQDMDTREKNSEEGGGQFICIKIVTTKMCTFIKVIFVLLSVQVTDVGRQQLIDI